MKQTMRTRKMVEASLLVALATDRESQLQSTLNTLERVWDEYKVYEKREDIK